MRSHTRKSSYALIGATLVMALSIGGCSSQSTPKPSAGSLALVQDVLGLQSDNGLFRMPESERSPVGDLYTTALYLTVDSKKKLAESLSVTTVDQKIATSDFSDLAVFWSTVTLDISAPSLANATLASKSKTLQLPPRQTNIGAEVGALSAWANTIRGFKKLSLPLPVTAEGTNRLLDINAKSVKNFPYLAWKLWDSYDALGNDKPEWLTKLVESISISTLPTNPESMFDTQAAAESARIFKRNPSVPSGLVDHLKSLLISGNVNEDIVRVSILRTLSLIGQEELVQRYLQENVSAKRMDAATGLIQAIVQYPGTVEGAYLASRLLDQDFPRVVNSATISSLLDAVEDQKTDQLTKLKGLVALRRSGDTRWKDHLTVAKATNKALPRIVTVDQVSNYLATVDALVQVYDTVSFARLQKFEPTASDKDLSLLALQVLAKSAYFSNASELGGWFPEQQKSLEKLIEEPSEPLGLYVAGLSAMTNASLSGLTSPQFDAASKNLKKLAGCGKYKILYRSALDGAAPCSLMLSMQLMAVPGAYELDAHKLEGDK